MKETARIKKLFADLYAGNPWLDITIRHTLNNISAAQAAKKVAPQWNTIWEIVHHVVSWRLAVLQRVQGNILSSPPDNFFAPVTDASEAAWQQTLQQLEDSQQQWQNFLDSFDEAEFEKMYPNNNNSYYEHIHGILQHDAYHLGQVVLLAKAV